jgi:hypothetical protein
LCTYLQSVQQSDVVWSKHSVRDTSAFASKFAPRSILLMRSVRNWDLVWALPSAALEPYAHVLWVVRSKDSLDSKHDGRTLPWRYDIVCMCILQRLNTQAHSWLAETWTINSPFLSREIIRRTHWAGFFAFCFLLGAVHPSIHPATPPVLNDRHAV